MSAGFKIDPERVKREFERQIGRGLRGAAAFAANRAKEIVSVPAPRKRTKSGLRASTPAMPGAPPRKLSGTLRSRITSEVISDTQARVGLRLDYGAIHEYGDHPFLSVMIEKNRDALARLIAGG